MCSYFKTGIESIQTGSVLKWFKMLIALMQIFRGKIKLVSQPAQILGLHEIDEKILDS